MHMSILRHEIVPWSDNLHTDLGINRSDVLMHVLGTLLVFCEHTFTDSGVREAKTQIREVIASLPDDDIAELKYAIDEMDAWDVYVTFVRKAENLQELHQIIDAIEYMGTEEN